MTSELKGTIYPKGSMFLRKHVGAFEAPDGSKGEVSIAPDCSPLVELPDGRYFSLGWKDIIAMAVDKSAEQ